VSTSEEIRISWLDDPSVHDLIQSFPLPIAVLDDAGGALVLNHRFEETYGSRALSSAALQDMIRNPVPGWKTVKAPGREQGEVELKAQVVRVQGNPILILDDAADPDLLRKLNQLRAQISELEKLSSTDLLTGAWNRGHYDRVITSELDRSMRFKQPVSLIFLDIDHFKRVNDTYGHQAGDCVLRELVQVIGATIRSIDALFRWGGEEFVVLASSTGYREGAVLAEKIRVKVEQHRFDGVGPVTISLGVAEHVAMESTEIWFHRVDEALYRAKDGGRNRVSVDRRGSSDAWAAESGLSVIRLVWQEAYESGDPTIDRQHRELFELANALLEASFRAESSPEVFSTALEKLLAHIARHFADEETILAEHGYREIKAHRRAHAALLARAEELKASAAAGKTTLGDLVEFLASTVVAQHLFTADRRYFHLFRKQAG
jgi:diguanylate cyclase (GGDEF)-like protein/hemerythrin-like metal-binding protein